MATENYICFDHVSKVYGSIKAVDDLSFSVRKGDIYGFLGPNGAGKSTSIRMIMSLITPTAGSIKLFDKDLAYHRYQTLSRIGALIEKPDFYKYLSARKNLQILGRLSNVQNLNYRVDEVLDLVGLTERAKSKVKTFSQGMRQRLGIAQCLLHNPDLIILDEPQNGLDPQGQIEVREMIKKINVEHGITVLISSHILNEIEQIANRMVIINRGKCIVEGSVDELLNSGDLNVSFFIDNISTALTVVQNSFWVELLHSTGNNFLVFNLKNIQIAELNKFFVEHGININAIRQLRSLEDYFIKLTSND